MDWIGHPTEYATGIYGLEKTLDVGKRNFNVLPCLSLLNFLSIYFDLTDLGSDVLRHDLDFVVKFDQTTFDLSTDNMAGDCTMWEDIGVGNLHTKREKGVSR
jgi:hypothetical protein